MKSLFIDAFSKYLLNTYFTVSTVLGNEDSEMSKTDLTSKGFVSSKWETNAQACLCNKELQVLWKVGGQVTVGIKEEVVNGLGEEGRR